MSGNSKERAANRLAKACNAWRKADIAGAGLNLECEAVVRMLREQPEQHPAQRIELIELTDAQYIELGRHSIGWAPNASETGKSLVNVINQFLAAKQSGEDDKGF